MCIVLLNPNYDAPSSSQVSLCLRDSTYNRITKPGVTLHNSQAIQPIKGFQG